MTSLERGEVVEAFKALKKMEFEMIMRFDLLSNPSLRQWYSVVRTALNADTIYVEYGIKQHPLTQAVAHFKLTEDPEIREFCMQLN